MADSARGIPTLVEPRWRFRESHPSAQRVVSGLDFKAVGVDERSLVLVAMLGHHDEEAVP
jgi:hypothetical protein